MDSGEKTQRLKEKGSNDSGKENVVEGQGVKDTNLNGGAIKQSLGRKEKETQKEEVMCARKR